MLHNTKTSSATRPKAPKCAARPASEQICDNRTYAQKGAIVSFTQLED